MVAEVVYREKKRNAFGISQKRTEKTRKTRDEKSWAHQWAIVELQL